MQAIALRIHTITVENIVGGVLWLYAYSSHEAALKTQICLENGTQVERQQRISSAGDLLKEGFLSRQLNVQKKTYCATQYWATLCFSHPAAL